mmetsp:Transcript_7052/g.22635  ORF Transcript_7052/g.22635 Transcript_7052/m.22635 type:complete len:213 (+) Transcript_7052:328-966(+)
MSSRALEAAPCATQKLAHWTCQRPPWKSAEARPSSGTACASKPRRRVGSRQSPQMGADLWLSAVVPASPPSSKKSPGLQGPSWSRSSSRLASTRAQAARAASRPALTPAWSSPNLATSASGSSPALTTLEAGSSPLPGAAERGRKSSAARPSLHMTRRRPPRPRRKSWNSPASRASARSSGGHSGRASCCSCSAHLCSRSPREPRHTSRTCR